VNGILARVARYGNQQIWPEGVINAPWFEVLDLHGAICALVELENSSDDDKPPSDKPR
jgi:hypothetical protein